MRGIIATAILLLVVLLAALVAYILLRRAFDVLVQSYAARRRARLESALEAWLSDEDGALPAAILRPRPLIDRELMVELCLSRLPGANAHTRDRLHSWLDEQGLVSRWIGQLRHRSAWKRAAAVERLAVLQLPSCVNALVSTLDDEVFDVRMRAAKALGALGGERALKALVGALRDETRWSVIRIANLLAGMGPTVVDELVVAYPGMGRAARLATIDLIAHAGRKHVAPFLAPLLDDLDRDIRARAASALGRVGNRSVVPALVAALQDPEWPVRAMAAKALGELGSEASGQSLAASLRDREWWVRANAGEAMRKLGSYGIDCLVTMLDDPDQFARDQALAVLESCGELERRLALLVSDDRGEREYALELLHVLYSRQTRVRVDSIRNRHPDERVRLAIDDALLMPARAMGAGS